MGYVKLSAPPTIGNVTQNTGQFSTLGVGAAAVTSALYVNASNRIGAYITGTNVSTGADADGLFIDCSFAPSANVTNAASIGLYPTFNPPVGKTITTGYGLYVAAGTQGGAGAVTTGYGIYVTAPAFGTSNFAANIGGLVINSAGTGTITTGVWNGTPVDLAHGGTNANLTASNGGIFYSTATAGAILSGTATANQVLLSGSSTTPAWSTATYPPTTTINQLLYSSANNVITGLATANRAVFTTSSTGVPVATALAADGQLIIGSTAGAPAAATLTAGAGISITNASNSITIAASGAGFTWSDNSGTFTAVKENGYFITATSTATLPASPSEGDTVAFIVDTAQILTITGNTGQKIRIGSAISGAAGTAANNAQGDAVTLVYRSTGTTWFADSVIGTWTVSP